MSESEGTIANEAQVIANPFAARLQGLTQKDVEALMKRQGLLNEEGEAKEKPGRKATGRSGKTYSMYLPRALGEDIEFIAEQEETNFSSVVTRILRSCVPRIIQKLGELENLESITLIDLNFKFPLITSFKDGYGSNAPLTSAYAEKIAANGDSLEGLETPEEINAQLGIG